MLEVSSRLLGVYSFLILGTTGWDSLGLLGSAGIQNITHLDVPAVGNWLGRCSLRSFTCYWAGMTSNAIQRTKVHFSLLKLLLRLEIVVAALGTQSAGLSNPVARSRPQVTVTCTNTVYCGPVKTKYSFCELTWTLLRFLFSSQDTYSPGIHKAATTASNPSCVL